jgi:hypothetical protein
MSREPEAIVEQRRQLGAALATFRQAGALTQAQVGTETDYDRTSINKIERGHQLPDRPFWQAVDGLLRAEGVLVKQYDGLVANKRKYAEGQRRSSWAHHQEDAKRLRRAGQPIVTAAVHGAGMLSSWTIALVAVTWLAWPYDSSGRCISNLARVPTNRLLNVTCRPQQASWQKLPDGCSMMPIGKTMCGE